MTDERRPDDPEGLGLTAEDLADFDSDVRVGGEEDVGDQESSLGGNLPAVITEESVAPASADQRPTPKSPAERKPETATPVANRDQQIVASSSVERNTEDRQPTAGEKPTESAPSDPKPTSTAVVPWEPQADGRRLTIEGATVEADGSWRIPKGVGQQQLMSCLAFRPAWQQRERRYREIIEDLDPKTNRDVILSRKLALEMTEAAEKGDEKLWEWVQGFLENLPRLRAEAKAEESDAKLARLERREQTERQEQEEAELEPQLKAKLSEELDAYLEHEKLAVLKPTRAKLAARLWEMVGQLFSRADKDYPEHGLVKGQVFLQRGVLERELLSAADLIVTVAGTQQQQQVRTAAAKRNADALEEAPVPPSAPVGSRSVSAGEGNGRPKNAQEWRDRMDRIASS